MKAIALNILCLMMIVGCNPTKDIQMLSEADSRTMKARELRDRRGFSDVSCEIDMNTFNEFFSSDVGEGLDCIHDNLEMFIQYVRSDRPGNLAKEKLRIFIAKYYPEMEKNAFSALEALFKINTLLFNDDPNFIAPENVASIMDFLSYSNKEIVRSGFLGLIESKNMSQKEFRFKRTELLSIVQRISKRIIDLIKGRKGSSDRSLDIEKFMNHFITDENRSEFPKLDHLFLAKRLFLGGDKKVLRRSEMMNVLKNSGDIASLIFSLTSIKEIKDLETNTLSFLGFLRETIHKAKLLILVNNKNNGSIKAIKEKYNDRYIFNKKELFDVIGVYFKDYKHLEKYSGIIRTIKKIFLNPRSKKSLVNLNFYGQELKAFFDHVDNILKQSIGLYRLSHYYSDVLENEKTIKSFDIDLSIYRGARIDREQGALFKRIVSKYRFYKGENSMPFFGSKIVRDARGVVEVGAIEYLVKEIFKFYNPNQNRRRLYVQETDAPNNHVTQLFNDISSFLYDEDLILEGRLANSVESAHLLLTLFQYQSNGDSFIDLEEATEFLMTMISGISVADTFANQVEKACGTTTKTPFSCFENQVLHLLSVKDKKGESLKEFFPQLFSYIENSDEEERQLFFDEIASFSRSCHRSSVKTGQRVIPLRRNDLIAIFGGLLNVEQSFLRYDINENGLFDGDEAEGAFVVFKDALDWLIDPEEGNPSQSLSKNVYLFILENGFVPSKWQVAKQFGRRSSRKKSSVPRSRVATILKTIAEESPANKEFAKRNPLYCDQFL